MRSARRLRNVLYAAPVLIFAFFLRAYRLDGQSFWYDEGNSAFMTTRTLSEIIAGAAGDIHPPLYYVLLNWWSHLSGNTEFGLRFLSVICGLLLVVVIYKLGQKLFLPEAGLAAAGIAAMSPFLVYFSQEARMYMLGTLLCALAGLFFIKALEKDRFWVAYTLSAAAALYTQYYTFGVILAFNAFFALAIMWRSGRGLWTRWLGANLALALLYAPWLPVLAKQVALWPKATQALGTAGAWPAWANWVWFLGPLEPRDFAASSMIGPLTQPALILLAVSTLGWIRLGQKLPGSPRGTIGRSLGGLFVLVVTLVSWGSLLVPLWRPDFNAKFLVFGAPWLYLWLGLGAVSLAAAVLNMFDATFPLQRLRRSGYSWSSWLMPEVLPALLPFLILGVAAHMTLESYRFDLRYARDDYRGLASHVESQTQPGDAIILNAPGQTEVFRYYYKGQVPVFPLPEERPLSEKVTGQNLESIAAEHNRIWTVLWAQRESDPASFIERWLDSRGFKSSDRWFGGVRLVLYALPRSGEERSLSLDVTLGDYARLNEISFPGVPAAIDGPLARAEPGGIIPLSLKWEAQAPTPQRYKVFVHLLGPNATLWGQHDAEPAGGSRFTTDWRTGESVTDNHGLPVPFGTPPGQYEIEVGMYDMSTGRRLPVFDNTGESSGDRVVLRPVEVTKPASFPPAETLVMERRLTADFQGASLLGYEFFKLGTAAGVVDFRSGDFAHLALFWQANTAKRLPELAVRVALLDATGNEVTSHAGVSGYPTSKWDPGEIVREQYKIPLAVPPGVYRLALLVGAGAQQTPIQPSGSGLKLSDGRLLLTELLVK